MSTYCTRLCIDFARRSHRWNLLHQVILGIGSMCVLGDMGDGSDTLRLYDRASNAVNAALFGTSSLTSVQAFVLLGNYAQKLNHPSAGSVFLGEWPALS